MEAPTKVVSSTPNGLSSQDRGLDSTQIENGDHAAETRGTNGRNELAFAEKKKGKGGPGENHKAKGQGYQTDPHGHSDMPDGKRTDVPQTIEAVTGNDKEVPPPLGHQESQVADDLTNDHSDHSCMEGSQASADQRSRYSSSFHSSSVSSSLLTSSLSSVGISGGKHGSRNASRYDDESFHEDERARIMAPAMDHMGTEITQALGERVTCIESIKWLGHHLPESVVAFLIDEIEVEEARRAPMRSNGDGYLTPPFAQTMNHDNLADGDTANESNMRDYDSALVDDDSMQHDRDDGSGMYVNDAYSERGGGYDSDVFEGNDENDSDVMSMAAPMHMDETRVEEDFGVHRRHSCIGLVGPSNSLFSEEEEEVALESAKRRLSTPLIATPIDDILRSSRSNSVATSSAADQDVDSGGFEGAHHTVGEIKNGISVIQGPGSEGRYWIDTQMVGQAYPESLGVDVLGQQKQRLREDRMMKTRLSIQKLAGGVSIEVLGADFAAYDSDGENFYFNDAIPPATRHDCALLFVDISGFTKLSTTLEVEPLSKTINSYFQMIVDEVEAFGGDILKFAGDAVFCEWQATTSNPLDIGDGVSLAGSSQGSLEPWHGLGLEECVLTAAACGARIVDKCSDYPVYAGGATSGPEVAILNVHCGVGFGEVVGVHVGDRETRMEYLILGDPIEQVADAINVASRGEVVASPEALVILEETAELDQQLRDSDMEKPQIIAMKSVCYFHPKGSDHVQQDWTVILRDFTTKPRERLAKRCDDWDLAALKRLRVRMSLYVHPVVVNDEFAMKVYPGDRNRPADRHRSEAELRSVYTVFIMPLINAKLTGDDEEDCKILVLLNDMMLIMTRELARYKGQLRQFIVDDKGVVLIANFGLRGSTFPNMVAERAIPFTTTVQTLLKVELGVECRLGSTYDKAYCGVVGGVSRHEYAVLGPSVNLAARLMANKQNKGLLVAESVKQRAGTRQFRALPPVKAKGYSKLVPIFEPAHAPEGMNHQHQFVGREKETSHMVSIAEEIIDKGGPSRLVLVTAVSGAGKTALCSQTSKQIRQLCATRNIPHLVLSNVCSEGDVFVPFSIARPIFLDILNYIQDVHKESESRGAKEVVDPEQITALLHGGVQKSEVSQSLVRLVNICENAGVPPKYIEIIGRIILTRNRADEIEGPGDESHYIILIAEYIVRAFLQCTVGFDLVLLSLDDVSNMDEMSWKVVELLYEHSQNLMTIVASRPVPIDEMRVDGDFWENLWGEGVEMGRFSEIRLSPMLPGDVARLVAAKSGMSHLASEILEGLPKKETADRQENPTPTQSEPRPTPKPEPGLDVGNIGEIVLHRMDSLPSSVRTHLNLGAILGSAFELMDVVTVFEQYRGVTRDERETHAKSVHESLDEAVQKGILDVEDKSSNPNRYSSSDHPYAAYNVTYKFTHDVWRSNILRLTLDEWKRDMHSLIAQSMETVMDSQLANDYRMLTKLFCHWKEGGSAKKAASLALKMGRSLEDIGLTHQSLIVYRESLDMWKAMDNNEGPDETVGGLSMELLEKLDSSDIEHLIRLNVALGRCHTNILDQKKSVVAYQTALNFIHKAPSSVDLEDRAIIFPVFSGLFVALRFGHNEDFNYEQGLVRMFIRETQVYNDPVHYSRALAMKAEMFGRHGNFELAIEAAEELRRIYNVKEHSDKISRAYGSDRSGQCIAQTALWYSQVGRMEDAVRASDEVLNELLPNMDPCNVHNSFLMLYPIIWVLKNRGRALEARTIFQERVVKNFTERLDERGLTSDRPLHQPILALLDMVSTNCETEKLQDYMEWALREHNGLFGLELNFTMGSAGRTADTITAEVCLLLSEHATDRYEKVFFIRKGYEVARDAVELTREKDESRGMIVAYSQVKPIYDELEEKHSHLPPERRSRRLSCRF